MSITLASGKMGKNKDLSEYAGQVCTHSSSSWRATCSEAGDCLPVATAALVVVTEQVLFQMGQPQLRIPSPITHHRDHVPASLYFILGLAGPSFGHWLCCVPIPKRE